MAMIATTRLREIIGQPVSGIAFVQDYVEIHFDGKILRALARPHIRTDADSSVFPHSGSRDALCSLIGKSVLNVQVHETVEIELRFSGNTSVLIPLAERWRDGPEAAHYVPGENEPIEVW